MPESDILTDKQLLKIFLQIFEKFYNQNDNFFSEYCLSQNKKIDEVVFESGNSIFLSESFRGHIENIIQFNKIKKDQDTIPDSIINDYVFIRLTLSIYFLLLAFSPKSFTQAQIHNFSKIFNNNVRSIKEALGDCSVIEISYCLGNAIFDKRFKFDLPYLEKDKFDKLIFILHRITFLSGIFISNFEIPEFLGASLMKNANRKATQELNLRNIINELCKILRRDNFYQSKLTASPIDEDISSFDFYFRQREFSKVMFLLHKVFDDFAKISDDNFSKKRESLIIQSSAIRQSIKIILLENYKVFPQYRGNKYADDQWGNKIFLNTLKFLSTLEILNESHDNKWKMDAFVRYCHTWFDELHENINFHLLQDDWDSIFPLLKNGENDYVEYKSTFGFPIENIGSGNQEKIVQNIEEKIADTILAMANSGGGTIIVGIVEYPERVSDEKIKNRITNRQKFYFVDVYTSLRDEGASLDMKIRKIQALLHKKTGERMDILDNLFSVQIKEILPSNGNDRTSIAVISVEQGDKIFFLKREGKWITLPKRLHGRVELVSPEIELGVQAKTE